MKTWTKRESKNVYNKFKSANKHARTHGAEGSFLPHSFYLLWRLYNMRCYYCKQPIKLVGQGEPVTVDHYIPLYFGGTNYIWNIVPACTKCNHSKGRKLPWEFKKGETISPKSPRDWRKDGLVEVFNSYGENDSTEVI